MASAWNSIKNFFALLGAYLGGWGTVFTALYTLYVAAFTVYYAVTGQTKAALFFAFLLGMVVTLVLTSHQERKRTVARRERRLAEFERLMADINARYRKDGE